MQVSVEDISSVKKMLHVEIPEKDVAAEVDAAYKNLKKTAKIKGFRPGKAPRQVLERFYKKDVDTDVSSKLIQNSFVEVLKENKLEIVGGPLIDPSELEYDKPYKYDATVEILPVMNDIDLKGLCLKKNLYKVSDEEINLQLNALRRNLAVHHPLKEERPVQEGDFVLIDYEGFQDGKPFEHAKKTENYTMKIGAAKIAKELDEKLIGMKPGDPLEITASFPEDHFNKNFAGHKITFQIQLKDIREEVLPELDDEFAKKMGPYENLDMLKQVIVENLTQGYEKRTEQELSEQVFSKLIEKQEFEVPDAMIDAELDILVSDMERSFSYHNMPEEQIENTRVLLREKYRDVAEKQAKRRLILNKLIGQEKPELSDEELDKGMEDMALTFNNPIEAIKEFYKTNPDKLKYLKDALLEKKVIRLIINSSEIQEVELEIEKEAGV